MHDELPRLIEEVSKKFPKDLLKVLKSSWPEREAYETALHLDFQERLTERWGEAFSLMRMLLTTCREMGEAALKRLAKSRSDKKRITRSILLRLHARACQITAEIITLMENGFADGAMARWRTLYEIGVVAAVIADAGDEVARRYIDHDAIESKAALDEYDRCYALLGYRPVPVRERERTEHAYQTLVRKYGQDFRSPYGWAAMLLKRKRPTFGDLETAAQRSLMRPHYKMASYNVHAGPKGIMFRLGLLTDQEQIIAGASNAGFLDPGQNAAFTLTQITVLLYEGRMSKFDSILEVKTLALLRDEISRVLAQADRRLRRDHAAFVKQQKKRRTKKRN